jgi:hypothetical protein
MASQCNLLRADTSELDSSLGRKLVVDESAFLNTDGQVYCDVTQQFKMQVDPPYLAAIAILWAIKAKSFIFRVLVRMRFRSVTA